MKIGVIQASSQIEKNTILYECTKDYGEVINFGCFEDEENYSYVEIALEICLLISSGRFYSDRMFFRTRNDDCL